MNLTTLLVDSQRKQQKGIHFIIASVLIWTAIFFIHSSTLPINTKNLYTFFATAPLMPIAYIISKILKIDFTNKDNPLTNLGLIFSINQLLYLLIAMWVMNQQPESLVMVLAMIFGAHLLPYSWLYQSLSYRVFSIIIPLTSLLIGVLYTSRVLALVMIGMELSFALFLSLELKKLNKIS